MGKKPSSAAVLHQMRCFTVRAGMLMRVRGIRAAVAIPAKTNLLTCSHLPEVIREGEKLCGCGTTSLVNTARIPAENAIVAGMFGEGKGELD